MSEIDLQREVAENTKDIAVIKTQIEALTESSRQIKELSENTHEMITHVKTLAVNLDNINKRLECMESDKDKKGFAVWQAVICGAIGFVVSFLMSTMIK